jgi:hypothetical protein
MSGAEWRITLAIVIAPVPISARCVAKARRLDYSLVKRIVDRLEGKPVQKMKHELPHTTIFLRGWQGEARRELIEYERRLAEAADSPEAVR